MDDSKEKVRDLLYEATLHEAYAPLDFSRIHGFPNERYDRKMHDILPEFRGTDGVSATHHVASLCKLMSDFNVHHEDDIMIVFAITLEGDAVYWFYGLLDESIDSVAEFFERFLLPWHDGTVHEIEQLAREYDALIPRVHLELEENIEDLIEEKIQVSKQLHDEKLELSQVHEQFYFEKSYLPQVYATKDIHKQFYDDSDLHQDHFIIEDNSSCFANLLEQLYDEDQLDRSFYISPIHQWIEASCVLSELFSQNFEKFLYPNSLSFQIHEQILRYLCLMVTLSTFLSRAKHKEKISNRDEMLKWLHWLWAYT